ncbi:hypothetical protein DRP05_11185 [Archaeoglobales archaeon]|nr:MAG: hypothetical protein DRP05_11185 [Archaeoglobales archaeon]
MVWVNIDKPTKKCTIHTNPDCVYVIRKQETLHKGLEKLRCDGGWLFFSTLEDAESFCKARFSNYSVIRHC